MKIIFDLETFPEELQKSLNIDDHFRYLQPILDQAKQLPSGSSFASKVHNSRHVSRVAYLVDFFLYYIPASVTRLLSHQEIFKRYCRINFIIN